MAAVTFVFLAVLCTLETEAVACADEYHEAATCASHAYARDVIASKEACCALCVSDEMCAQWTFHHVSSECWRTNAIEEVMEGALTKFSTCGLRRPKLAHFQPITPAPERLSPSVRSGSKWAVIAVGSQGSWNYRHQADACHAYHVMRKTGIPADNIILMMQDDIAHGDDNLFPGQLFNRPGDNPPDVYDGCQVDYRGSVVTAKLFLNVILGKESAIPGGGKVLRSGPNDRVFLNFIDHGGVGIVAFPNGPVLHASQLSKALKQMQQKRMFNELIFYMEACESGSMFPNLTHHGKIFAVTASNASESSWGTYCSPHNDVVKGKHMGTCLGDLFSVSWTEDADHGHLSKESIAEQVKKVTKRTWASHVSTFGDKSFLDEAIGRFELAQTLPQLPTASNSTEEAVDIRDVPLRLANSAWEQAKSEPAQQQSWERLRSVVAARAADEQLFERIVARSCAGRGYACSDGLLRAKHALNDLECHQSLAVAVHEACPRRDRFDAGGWNAFNMKFSQTLVNLCETRVALSKDSQDLEKIVRGECGSDAAAPVVAGEGRGSGVHFV